MIKKNPPKNVATKLEGALVAVILKKMTFLKLEKNSETKCGH